MNLGCETYRRFHRRDFLRIGGASLCGVSMLDVLRAQAAAAAGRRPRPSR